MRVSKQFSFDEAEVRQWCDKAGDNNDLYLNGDDCIVPEMMLLDRVSGLITQWGETQQGTPVISRMSHVVFNEAVYFDEEIQVAVEVEEKQDMSWILRFEVTDSVTADPRAQGYITVNLL